MSDRDIFQRERLPADAASPGPASERPAVGPVPVEPPPAPVTRPAVKFMLFGWLAIGLIGLAWGLSKRWVSDGPPYHVPTDAPDVAPVATPPAYAEPAPVPAPAPQPAAEITDVRIGGDVSVPFYSISDTRAFSNGPAAVGLALTHRGYSGSDGIEVELFSNGVFVSRCARTALNTLSGLYWCQFRQVPVGTNQFRVVINGVLQRQYDFTVAPAARVAIENPAPTRQIADPSSRSGRNANERAARDQRQERAVPTPPETVTCVLPSGDETLTTRQNCRQRSGVIW